MGLAASVFKMFLKKNFWWDFRPVWVTHWKEFKISLKKRCFEIFGKSKQSRLQQSLIRGTNKRTITFIDSLRLDKLILNYICIRFYAGWKLPDTYCFLVNGPYKFLQWKLRFVCTHTIRALTFEVLLLWFLWIEWAGILSDWSL